MTRSGELLAVPVVVFRRSDQRRRGRGAPPVRRYPPPVRFSPAAASASTNAST
jgi:hypothetical protein